MESEFVVSDVVGGRELDGHVGHLLDQRTMFTREVTKVRQISFGQNKIVPVSFGILIYKEKNELVFD